MTRTPTGTIIGVILAIAALLSAPPAGPAPAVEQQVRIDNFTFAPVRITVKAGTTITWANADDTPHTVVSTAGHFRSRTLDTDDRYAFTFTTPGVYYYFCSLHPHMTGIVVVEAETGSGADGRSSIAYAPQRGAPAKVAR